MKTDGRVEGYGEVKRGSDARLGAIGVDWLYM